MKEGNAIDDLTRLANAVLQPGFDGLTPPAWLRRALDDGLGGVLLWDRNIATPAQLAELTGELRAENSDVLIAIDEEGGDVTRLEAATGSSWPGNAALGVIDDVELTRVVAGAIGHDLAAVGVNLNYAPVADTNVNPNNPVIGVRSFGADPGRVAAHTAAFVTGLQARGVAACVKHFPGHGDTNVDSHLGLPVLDDDAESLAAGALLPFRAAITAGVGAVMSAHIVLPAVDSVPATLSRRLLTGILREDLGHDGLIITDAIEMAAIKKTYGLEEGTVQAIAAGADMVCIGGWRDAQAVLARLRDALIAAVHSGRLAEERLAEAAGRARRLAAWAASTRGNDAAGTAGDRAVGLDASRRALHVIGTLTPLPGPPHVIELSPAVNAQIGPTTQWGLAAALARLLPATTGQRLTAPSNDLAAVTAAHAGRPLVIAVRDAHRHPWISATLHTLLKARPDAIIVEMGLPHGGIPPCGAYLATYGAAAVCGLAAAEVLAGTRKASLPSGGRVF